MACRRLPVPWCFQTFSALQAGLFHISPFSSHSGSFTIVYRDRHQIYLQISLDDPHPLFGLLAFLVFHVGTSCLCPSTLPRKILGAICSVPPNGQCNRTKMQHPYHYCYCFQLLPFFPQPHPTELLLAKDTAAKVGKQTMLIQLMLARSRCLGTSRGWEESDASPRALSKHLAIYSSDISLPSLSPQTALCSC